ncbi:hypothetical protein [Methanococcoides vulcani]|uniref:hypothetical protein n=1 Tax=Methanococcoides vulcani TaxID=1353158 RepID=UPI0015A64D3D|nr:hypothetical protein [Methanococcoides vulcani]
MCSTIPDERNIIYTSRNTYNPRYTNTHPHQKPSQIHTTPTYTNPWDEKIEASIERICQSVRIGALCGASSIIPSCLPPQAGQ